MIDVRINRRYVERTAVREGGSKHGIMDREKLILVREKSGISFQTKSGHPVNDSWPSGLYSLCCLSIDISMSISPLQSQCSSEHIKFLLAALIWPVSWLCAISSTCSFDLACFCLAVSVKF